MPATTQAGPAAPWTVLITGLTSTGKTSELGRHLDRATAAATETGVAARHADDRAALGELTDIARTAATVAETAAMIDDARAEMRRRYALESGAKAADFGWLVIAIDDYDFARKAARHCDPEAGGVSGQPARAPDPCVKELLAMADRARIAVALTGAPGLARDDSVPASLAEGIRHVSLSVRPAAGKQSQ